MKNSLKNYLYDYDFRMVVQYSMHDKPYINHLHKDFYELVFVREGRGYQLINGVKQKLTIGDVFVIIPGVSHEYVEVDNLGIYNIMFGKSFFKYFQDELKNFANYHLLFPINERTLDLKEFLPEILTMPSSFLLQLDALSKNIMDELQENKGGARVAALSDFLKLMLQIVRYAEIKIETNNKNLHLQAISRLLAQLDDNFADEWDMEKMAKFAGMPVNNFRFKFKDLTCYAPLNYLMKLRLEKSLLLLKHSKYNISEIANFCGFIDSNYYSRQFKKYFDKTPRDVLRLR